MEAEDSRYQDINGLANTYHRSSNRKGDANLAVLALPDKVGFAPAAADLVAFLGLRVSQACLSCITQENGMIIQNG